jgi:hypothetical protein
VQQALAEWYGVGFIQAVELSSRSIYAARS